MTGCKADINFLWCQIPLMETTGRGASYSSISPAGTRKTFFIIHFVLNFHATQGNLPKFSWSKN